MHNSVFIGHFESHLKQDECRRLANERGPPGERIETDKKPITERNERKVIMTAATTDPVIRAVGQRAQRQAERHVRDGRRDYDAQFKSYDSLKPLVSGDVTHPHIPMIYDQLT